MLLLALGALLSGCAAPPRQPGATYDRIGKELQGAIASKPKTAEDALSQAMMPPMQLELPVTAQSIEPHFDLAVNNAPAAQVFMALVSGTRYSMLVGPEVSGNVTVNLKSVTVREALETLRELYGYEFKFQGTRIYIQPNTIQTRIFQINYLSGRRLGQSDLRVSSSSISNTPATGAGAAGTAAAATGYAPTTTGATGNQAGMLGNAVAPSSRITTSSDNDFWKELNLGLTAIVGNEGGRAVIITPASGVVLVKGYPADLRAVENYLRATQVIVERQVMLEAKILDVQLNDEFQSGVNWSAFGGSGNRYAYGAAQAGTTLNSTTSSSSSSGVSSSVASVIPGAAGIVSAASTGAGLYGLAFQSANFAALLNFLESQGSVQVLSSPRIASINNQKAVLKVGSDEFYVTNVSSTTTTSSTSNVTTPSITLQPFFSGIALDITPQIDEDNNIILHVHPSISTVSEKQKTIDLGSMGTFTLPLASSSVNETDSIVRVQDANIVAIGGLMKQEQSSGAAGLPGTTGSAAGALFGTRSSVLKKRELVILIKPTIIRNDSSWKDDLSETQDRLRQLDPRLMRQQQPLIQ
ncbi:pilus (MSHA type) biogenesis protein MshL [Propionivibrio dicarboxylicus]|uniref:MSHA biogenesis protein MshL n=1 Tax=Propionivibrio dicarboxylicus TaxID=83767 RepID=A0A1G8IK23_9RHOO|nr:pilus (MSHA type) biogenesis protein MshL [Propionivibrio dicarboxylicus]SDI19339.1 MSHA biogenesis protein MshL [Propionivibrio dicarboxylicus]